MMGVRAGKQMINREKVIEHLKDCANIAIKNGWVFVRSDIVHDALELLKAQEPRVLALEEIDGTQEHNCEYYTETLIEPNMGYARISYDGDGHMCMIKGTRYDVREDMYDYGKTWRCWTSRPTDEQREAVKWE